MHLFISKPAGATEFQTLIHFFDHDSFIPYKGRALSSQNILERLRGLYVTPRMFGIENTYYQPINVNLSFFGPFFGGKSTRPNVWVFP